MGGDVRQMDIAEKDLTVQVDNLTFGYGGPAILKDLNLRLPRGARCLLVGANGAGKTTLLRILAGKRMIPGVVKVLGVNAFLDAPKGVTYLGTEWAANPVVRSDLQVDYLLKTVGGDKWPERRDKLIDVLDVDVNWKMHQVSDGKSYCWRIVNGRTPMVI
jgi:CCR4-NOT complex subunit CAF16